MRFSSNEGQKHGANVIQILIKEAAAAIAASATGGVEQIIVKHN